MGDRRAFEYRVLRFVPNPVNGMGANVGVVLVEVGTDGGRFADVRLTDDWSLAHRLDPDFDVDVVLELVNDLKRLLSSRETNVSRGGEAIAQRDWALYMLEDWFSTALQVSSPHAVMTGDPAEELGRLVKMYCELPVQHRREETGRGGILRGMRGEFEQAGVWELMSKQIQVQRFTRHGDPLKIDCGYRWPREFVAGTEREDQKFRMFHAVSLKNDVNSAKVLAFTFGDFRDGLEEEVKATAELTAVVEEEV